MIDKQTITRLLNDELAPLGFKRKGSSWYLTTENVISVLDLQKSMYDDAYFLNLAFWLRSIADSRQPKHYQCHVRGRAESLWRAEEPNIVRLLDNVTSCSDCDERMIELRSFVRERVIPVLLGGATISGLKKIIEEYDGFVVQVIALEILGM